MNKRGFSTTAVWVVGVFVILLIAILFLVAVLFVFATRGESGIVQSKDGMEFENANSGLDVVLQKNFNAFLTKEVEFEGGEISIVELIERSEIEKGEASDLFSKEADEYFSEIMPLLKKWERLGSRGWWVRAYNKDDEVSAGDRSFVVTRHFHVGTFLCEPFSDESITLEYSTEDKKLILCVIRDYYEDLVVVKGGVKDE